MFGHTHTVLFVDDEAIAGTVRLSRVYERPRKFGTVVTPDRPWERHCVIVYGSVIPHPGGDGYQMWYQTYSRHERGPGRAYFCYAHSRDGVHWEKPSLGIYEYEGSRDNNIIMITWGKNWLSTLTVIYDENEEQEDHRYKMLFSASEEPGGPGLYVAFSPDGIHWNVRHEPVCTSASDRTTLMHDPELECKYVAFTRRHGMKEEFRRRVIYRSESSDFLTWTDPVPVVVPDLEDSWDVQFYGMSAFRYRHIYIGCLKRLWSTPDRIDTELVFSRDSRSWQRTRRAFLEAGEKDAWDSAWVGMASSPPIERDGNLWFYHEGRNYAHVRGYPFPRGAIGLAILPKDRFAALEAGCVEGIVTTRPLTWPGGRLKINANACITVGANDQHAPGGAMRVEVIGRDGTPIPGFTYGESQTFSGDDQGREPIWMGGASLDNLKGQTISLRIYLVNARLYAIYRQEL